MLLVVIVVVASIVVVSKFVGSPCFFESFTTHSVFLSFPTSDVLGALVGFLPMD